MEPPHVFMKARLVAFSCIFFTSFVWTILLCLIIFWRWDLLPTSLEKILVVLLLCTNFMTLVLTPMVHVLQFRLWLDVARLVLLLFLQMALAAAFSFSNTSFVCPVPPSDKANVCKLLNICILLASWINPILLLTYAAGLGYMLYHRSRALSDDMFEFVRDEGESSSGQSTLRDMQATVTPFVLSEQAPIPPWLDLKDNEKYLAPRPNLPASPPNYSALMKAQPMSNTQMMVVGSNVSVPLDRKPRSPHGQGWRSPSSPRSMMPTTPPPVSLSPAAHMNRDRQFALAQPPPQRLSVSSRSKSLDGHTHLPYSPSNLRFSTATGPPSSPLAGTPPKGEPRTTRAQSLVTAPVELTPPLPSPWDSYHNNRNSQSTLQSLDRAPAWGYAM